MKKFRLLLIVLMFVFPNSVFANDLTIMPIYSTSHGEATLLKSNNEYLLIDVTTAASTHVIDFLKNEGVEKFSIYLSHYHDDHFGANNTLKLNDESMSLFEYLIRNSNKGDYDYIYSIENIYIPDSTILNKPEFESVKPIADSIKMAAMDANINLIELKQGSTFKFGNTSAEVLYFNTETIYLNNSSLVTMFLNGNTKYLNSGDIEKETEEILVNSNIDISADIFKLNHHGIALGTNMSNSEKFMLKVKPKYSYLTDLYSYEKVGQSIKNSANVNSNIYSIQKNGNIKFIIKDDKITPIIEKNKHTIIINYVDENNNDVLKTNTYDFNYDIMEIPINYYLYDYEENFENYTIISNLSEIPQNGILTEDKIFNIKYKNNKSEVLDSTSNDQTSKENEIIEDNEINENPKTGQANIYLVLISLICISYFIYVYIRKLV